MRTEYFNNLLNREFVHGCTARVPFMVKHNATLSGLPEKILYR